MHISNQFASQGDEPADTRHSSSVAFGKYKKSAAERVCNPDGMPYLHDIDFVEHVGEPRNCDPEHRHEMIQEKMAIWRQVFLEGLTRQICLARDPEFRYPSHQFVECEGVTGRKIVYVAPDPWWFEQDDALFLRLNFGERDWCVAGKNPVIRIGKVEELVPTLEKLHILTDRGEFDEIIERMVIVSWR